MISSLTKKIRALVPGHMEKRIENLNKETPADVAADINTDYRSYALDKNALARWHVISIPSLALIGLLFYHSLLAMGLLVILCLPLRRFYADYLCSKRKQELIVQFKDVLSSLSASFATGRQMQEALVEAYDNLSLIYKANAPMLRELTHINRRMSEGHENEREVLFDFADRSASDEIVNFFDVYFTCMTTGADRIMAVSRASEMIADKLDIKTELAAITAQKKLEGGILTALPPLMIAFLSLSSPDYIAPLYGNSAGVFIMSASLLLMGVAFLWSMKITNTDRM